MRRSLRVDRVAIGPCSPAERVVVATAFVHPDRGRVTCPAATLLAGSLSRVGVPVEYRDWTECTSHAEPNDGPNDEPNREPNDRWQRARTVSYLDRDGAVVGLAAAAPAGGDRLDTMVRAALGEWIDVLRSRRIVLAATRPVCSGQDSAARTLEALVRQDPGPVFVLGGAPDDVGLNQAGVVFVDTIDDVPDGARVLIAQAGASPSARARAAVRDVRLVDATCPRVAATAREVRTLAEQGETVVLIADPEQAVVPGLVGQAPEHVMIVNSAEQATTVEVADPGRVAVVRAPGAPLSETVPLAEAVRGRFGHVIPQHPMTVCAEPSDRAAAVLRLAAETDVVLVVGPDSADGRGVAATVRRAGTRCHQIAAAQDIEPGWLRGVASIGITASRAAGPGLLGEITDGLIGLGPAAVVELAASTLPVTRTTRVAVTPG